MYFFTTVNCEAITETIEKTLSYEVKPVNNPGLEGCIKIIWNVMHYRGNMNKTKSHRRKRLLNTSD